MTRRHRRGDGGAAAVEFALLLPIFVLLTFGTLTAGFALFDHIGDVQAARDAARYGSTLNISAISPVPTGSLSATGWVAAVRDVALRQTWGLAGASAVPPANGYLCVSFVQGTVASQSGSVPTASTFVGSAHNGYVAPTSAQPCIDPSSEADTSYDRVQVVVIRDAQFYALPLARNWAMTTATTIRYERAAK